MLLDWLPAAARPRVVEARSTAAAVRAAATAGGYEAKVRGLLEAAGQEVRPAPSLDVPASDPIAGLRSAAVTALDLLGRRSRADLGREARAIEGAFEALREPPGSNGSADPDRYAVVPSVAPVGLDAALAAARAPAAALILASALDRYLPALEAAPQAGGEVDGCDIVDEVPVLCIGSELDNTYVDDVALLIDLGGNDVYRNSAGGAPFPIPGTPVLLGASVNVDLGDGDDTYLFADRTTADDLQVAQAGATFGAVGILIDEGGDDAYTVEAGLEGEDGSINGSVVAQGAAVGGIALLADREGRDVYRVEAPSTPGGIGIAAQGAGIFCAVAAPPPPIHAPGAGCPVGVLVDRGMGDDRYELLGGDALGGGRSIVGQGHANLGLGALVDDGGADVFSVRARSTPPTDVGSFGSISVAAQGAGLIGSGLLLEGVGPTRYEIETQVGGHVFQRVNSQAFGNRQNALGMIQDLGGDDVYEMRALLEDYREIVVGDECGCDSAEARVEGYPLDAGTLVEIELRGQAMAFFDGSSAIIDDAGGDDEYVASAVHDLRVSLIDELSDPAAPPSLDVVAYAPAWMEAQAVGYSRGTAVVADADGNDAYTWESITRGHAEATSRNAEGEANVSALGVWGYIGTGQGIGDNAVGALVDLGGMGDRFTATAERTVTTAPDPDGASQVGWFWPKLQGSGTAGALVALGEDPQILSHPSRPVCALSPDPRGFGQWVDCPLFAEDPSRNRVDGAGTAANGHAPNALGSPSTMTFLPSTPSTAVEGDRLPVEVRVTGPGGAPIAGVPVHFDLQEHRTAQLNPLYANLTWANMWEVRVVTDADGVARAHVPTDVNRMPFRRSADSIYRVMATFDGLPGIHPDHAAAPITIEPAD